MYWLTEDPTYAVMTGLLVALALGCFGYMAKERILSILAVLAILLTIGVVIAERAIITDREEIESTLYDLAGYVANNRHDDILRHIDPNSEAYRAAQQEMPKSVFKSCNIYSINELEVDDSSSPPSAVSDFVATGSGTAAAIGEGWGRRAVTLHWKKFPDGSWKIVRYSHREPTSDFNL